MQAHARALDRARRDSEKVYKRIGHRALFMRILEDGYFETATQTKIEASLNSEYLEAIRMISEGNAKIT